MISEIEDADLRTPDEIVSESGSGKQGADKQAAGSAPSTGAKRNRRSASSSPVSLENLVTRFSACGRCSFFLSGLRIQMTPAAFQDVLDASQQNELEFVCDAAMRRLVHKSYGNRLDVDYFHYECYCPNCRRRIVFDRPDDGVAMLKIAV